MIYMFLSFMIAIKANANVESYRKLVSGSIMDTELQMFLAELFTLFYWGRLF